MKIIWTFTLLMIPGVVSSMSVTGYSGGGVNITCKYEEKYTENKKYFCKGQWSECRDQIKTDIKDKWVQSGRFSLYDDTSSAVFTVTIRDLREGDSDTYYCGTDIYAKKDPHTEVNLKVLTGTPSPPSSTTSSSSSSTTTTRTTTTSSSSSSSPSSASSSSSVEASPFTGSSLIVPLVLVLLVLIIAGLLLLFLCKKYQSQGGDPSSQTGPGKHEVVSHTGCDYEDIKDTHKQLPTNPSDSSVTVYATAQLPTSPSVSSNCVYATVEKGTGDSQCCITSAEDLNYAVVNFHKKSDCPDSVSFRNNQDYSEYAAVNHLTA